MATIKSYKASLEILKNYSGQNPYILSLKKEVMLYNHGSALNDFAVEYINSNHDRAPIQINKVIQIADWYGEKLKEEYGIEFMPAKLKILACFGETKTSFHILAKWRQNMDGIELFVSKKAILGDFLITDYHDTKVDFDRYDRLSMAKNPDRKMKPHQKEAVQFLLTRKKCILADDQGLGKSLELAVASIEGNFDSVIIICPASLKTNWKKELSWYVPERDITIIESTQGMNKKELEKFLGYAEGKSGLKLKELQDEAKDKGKWTDNRFVIINYDILDEFYKLPKSYSKENLNAALEQSPMLKYIKDKKSLIIIDEAHRLSNNTSIRYKVIKSLIKIGNPDSIYLATGTPITNNPQNLFCLLQLIGDPITDDWQYYMDRYCGAMKIPAKGEKARWTEEYLKSLNRDFKSRGISRVVGSYYDLNNQEKDKLKEYIKSHARMINIANGATNLDELKLKISNVYLRRTKEDLDEGLPAKTIHEVFYDFSMKQMMEYNRLWEEYEAAQLELDPFKEINKELLEGAVYRKYCSNEMVENTIRLADGFISKGEKVVIATCYDEELNMLKEYYGDRCVIYNGKMTPKQKDAAQKAFMEDPSKMVFIGQIIAAGVGLTLTVSHVMIFNNISYVFADNMQMCDRIHRIGQTKDVDIYVQIFRGTQYERIWNTSLRKEFITNSVIKKEDEK